MYENEHDPSHTTLQMFLEIERARLTRRLAAIREAEGKIDEASDVLQEIAPETHGTMDKFVFFVFFCLAFSCVGLLHSLSCLWCMFQKGEGGIYS